MSFSFFPLPPLFFSSLSPHVLSLSLSLALFPLRRLPTSAPLAALPVPETALPAPRPVLRRVAVLSVLEGAAQALPAAVAVVVLPLGARAGRRGQQRRRRRGQGGGRGAGRAVAAAACAAAARWRHELCEAQLLLGLELLRLPLGLGFFDAQALAQARERARGVDRRGEAAPAGGSGGAGAGREFRRLHWLLLRGGLELAAVLGLLVVHLTGPCRACSGESPGAHLGDQVLEERERGGVCVWGGGPTRLIDRRKKKRRRTVFSLFFFSLSLSLEALPRSSERSDENKSGKRSKR